MSKTQGKSLKGGTAKVMDLGVYGMKVSIVDPQERGVALAMIGDQYGGGCITSALKEQFYPDADELATIAENFSELSPSHTEICQTCGSAKLIEWECPCCGTEIAKAEGCADGIESFILALACEGYDVKAPGFVCALEIAIEAIGNNL